VSLAERAEIYEALKQAIDAGVACGSATIVRGTSAGRKLALLPDGVRGTLGSATLDRSAISLLGEALTSEQSVTSELADSETGETFEVFFEVFPAPPVLLIFGAVHVAQALTKLGKMLGFRVIVSDARAKLATSDRFPDADEIIQAWPDDALTQIELPPSTYVAILTHDPKFDEPALLGSIQTNARYIGAVGSRKTNADRRERLIAAGLSEESLSRIRGPIGLDIGAESPEEMAVSIMAEIIAIRHGRAGGALTFAKGNIRGTRSPE
jgi:xanthine dehydrogenase accessory factor